MRPKGAKEILLEQEDNDPKNWVTRTCCYCGVKFPINRKFCNMYERETDASYCAACQKKLFGSD